MDDNFTAAANTESAVDDSDLEQLIDQTKKTQETTDKSVSALFESLTSLVNIEENVIDAFKQGIDTIYDFDDALAEMQKVSNESLSSLKGYQEESFNLANSVGSTSLQIQNSTTDWMRLGDSLEEAKKHAVDAITLFKISEFDNVEEATEALSSISQAWSDADTSHINDVLNSIGNNLSIPTDELALSLQSSAGTLAALGTTFEEASALMAAGNSILQDPESVAAGKMNARMYSNIQAFLYNYNMPKSSYIG